MRGDPEILPQIRARFSPRAFANKEVEDVKLKRLLQAVQLAPSSGNQQPWRIFLGKKGSPAWQNVLDTLDEGNRVWCKDAPVLALIVGYDFNSWNNQPNEYHQYDCGQAAAYFSLQAVYEGLYLHQMAGFSKEEAEQKFSLPAEYKPLACMAIGYLGDPANIIEKKRKAETARSPRKSSQELFFAHDMNTPFLSH